MRARARAHHTDTTKTDTCDIRTVARYGALPVTVSGMLDVRVSRYTARVLTVDTSGQQHNGYAVGQRPSRTHLTHAARETQARRTAIGHRDVDGFRRVHDEAGEAERQLRAAVVDMHHAGRRQLLAPRRVHHHLRPRRRQPPRQRRCDNSRAAETRHGAWSQRHAAAHTRKR
jgi:hypothetical protein